MQEMKRSGLHPWVGKIPWRRKCQPTPVCLPGKSHGQGSLADYSPQGHKESDTTEQLNTPPKACISLSYTGTLYHPGSLSYHPFCSSPVFHFYGLIFWWKLIVPSSVNVPAYLLSPSFQQGFWSLWVTCVSCSTQLCGKQDYLDASYC